MVPSSKILTNIDQKPFASGRDFALYKANCIDLLNQLPECSVDMIFADPPYNLSNGGISMQSGRTVSVNKGKWDASRGFVQDYAFHLEWISACRRVLKEGGTMWITGTYHSIYQCGHALQSLDFHVLNDIAWVKPCPPPNISCRFFTASHETILWARKEKSAKHVFNYKDMKEGDWPGDPLKAPGKQMRSVWQISPPQKWEKEFGKHPTQKPVELLKRIILASTNPGDIVLDPFAGSSTTGVAALKHGRRYLGIDNEPEYLALSHKRLSGL